MANFNGDPSFVFFLSVLTLGVVSACLSRMEVGPLLSIRLVFFACLLLVSVLTGTLMLARHELWAVAGFTLGMMTVIAVWDAKPSVQPEF